MWTFRVTGPGRGDWFFFEFEIPLAFWPGSPLWNIPGDFTVGALFEGFMKNLKKAIWGLLNCTFTKLHVFAAVCSNYSKKEGIMNLRLVRLLYIEIRQPIILYNLIYPRDQIISRAEKWKTISLKLARPEKINSSDHSRATNTVFFWCRKTSRDQFISRAEKWSSRFEESLKRKKRCCHQSIPSQCFFKRRKSSRDQINSS